MTTTEITSTCSNCGGPVSTKGPTSKSGQRFCSRKGCQTAKARARRLLLSNTRPAPSECAGCRMALPPRNWRAGDENGRWCTKVRCRRKRESLSAEAAQTSDALRKAELLENAISLLSEAVEADNEDYIQAGRVVCHECGLTSALRGWPHQGRDNAPCRGTVGERKPRPVQAHHLFLAWPFRREYLSAKEIAAAYGDPS